MSRSISQTHSRSFVQVDLHQNSLTGEQNICVMDLLLTLVLDGQPPLPAVFEPFGFGDLMAVFDVTIEVPFLRCSSNVFLDFCAAGIESRPVGIGVERECLYCVLLHVLSGDIWRGLT